MPCGCDAVRPRCRRSCTTQIATADDDLPGKQRVVCCLAERGMQMLFARPAAGGGVELAGKVTWDNGQTWSEAMTVMKLPTDHWSTPLALLAHDGELHLFWMVDRGRGGRPGIEYMIDIWHSRSSDGRTKWPEPRCIWKGYVGSINGMAQLRSGRIVVPFAYWRGGVPRRPDRSQRHHDHLLRRQRPNLEGIVRQTDCPLL